VTLALTSSLNARTEAKSIIKQLGIHDAAQIDLEAIAFALGVLVYERPLRGSLARLVRRGNKGVIAVRERIREIGQKRFCIAHELGHFALHDRLDQLVFCTDEMLAWYKTRPEELEANEFAAELLMPEDLFRSLAHPEPTWNSLGVLAETFRTTMTATLIRYVELGICTCALVHSHAGTIRWFRASDEFPFRMMSPGSTVDPTSCAWEFFQTGKALRQSDYVPASAWIEDSLSNTGWVLQEILFASSHYNSALSLLTVAQSRPTGYFDDDRR